MGSSGSYSEKLSQTLLQLRTRLEYEQYFADDYLPLSKSDDLNLELQSVEAQKIELPLEGQKVKLQSKIQVSEDSKQVLVNSLYEKVKICTLCDLHRIRTNPVFGEGSLDADLVFIGEAPGQDEDFQAKPLVGMAGDLLTKIINAMGMGQSEVYITNVLRCMPADNRNPKHEEAVCCKPYLIEFLKIIKPKVICTLGKLPVHILLNETSPISSLRGKFFDFNGIKLMPTYHPEYLLKNPEDKKLVWDDMKKIMNVLK